MVDGRRSLISYRGKEGGDHVYGMYGFANTYIDFADLAQITSSHLMTAMHESTKMLRSDWSAGSWKATMALCSHTV